MPPPEEPRKNHNPLSVVPVLGLFVHVVRAGPFPLLPLAWARASLAAHTVPFRLSSRLRVFVCGFRVLFGGLVRAVFVFFWLIWVCLRRALVALFVRVRFCCALCVFAVLTSCPDHCVI